MEAGLYFDAQVGLVHRRDPAGPVLVFDAWSWAWRPSAAALSAAAEPVTPVEALRRLSALGGVRRLPIAVVGPRDATAAQVTTARVLGAGLADLGLTVICGGRSGVMAAVAAGVRAAGGLIIGLLPDDDWRRANDDIVIPVATGLGEARNAVIARAAAALIAVGGSYGTMTEVAYGLKFGKPVIGLADPPAIPGLIPVADVDAALSMLAGKLVIPAAMS